MFCLMLIKKNRLGREPVFYLVVGGSLFGSFSGGFSRFPGGLNLDGLRSAGCHCFSLRFLGRKEFENIDGDDHGVGVFEAEAFLLSREELAGGEGE